MTDFNAINKMEISTYLGKLPGLVVNVENSQPEPGVQFPGLPKNQMDKIDHLMAEKNKNNKDNQKGQVTPKNIFLIF